MVGELATRSESGVLSSTAYYVSVGKRPVVFWRGTRLRARGDMALRPWWFSSVARELAATVVECSCECSAGAMKWRARAAPSRAKERANISFFIFIMFFAVFGVIVLTELLLLERPNVPGSARSRYNENLQVRNRTYKYCPTTFLLLKIQKFCEDHDQNKGSDCVLMILYTFYLECLNLNWILINSVNFVWNKQVWFNDMTHDSMKCHLGGSKQTGWYLRLRLLKILA